MFSAGGILTTSRIRRAHSALRILSPPTRSIYDRSPDTQSQGPHDEKDHRSAAYTHFCLNGRPYVEPSRGFPARFEAVLVDETILGFFLNSQHISIHFHLS